MKLTPAGAAGNSQNGQILNCSAIMISISVHDNTIDVLEAILELIPEPLLRTISTTLTMMPPNTDAIAPMIPNTAVTAPRISPVMNQGTNSGVDHCATAAMISEAMPKPFLGPTFGATGIAVCHARPSQPNFPDLPVRFGYQPGGVARSDGWGSPDGLGRSGTGVRLIAQNAPGLGAKVQ